MSLFWKHIFRSQKSRPLQPLLILFTVICSVAVAVAAVTFTLLFHGHTYEQARQEEQLGDIIITPRGDSNLRLTFPEDAEALVGTDGQILGEFRLSGFLEGTQKESLFRLSCVDLQAADGFYQFQYLQYGCFTQENLNSSAVLSQSAAEEHGLAVGDRFTVSVLGEQFTYTVQAIAKNTGLLVHSEALISIDGMRAALAARVPAIASLGDAFRPYTRLLIQVNNGVSTDALIERLQSAPAFEKMAVSNTYDPQQVFFLTTVQTLSVWLPCILLMLLTALLLVTCLQALQRQRSQENALFRSCGATQRHLSLLLLSECAMYAILGAGLGILVARPLLRAMGSLYAWVKEPLDIGFGAILFGILWAGVLMGGCVLWHIRSQEELSLTEALQEVSAEEEKRLTPKSLFSALSVLAISLLLVFFVPMSKRYIPALGVLLSLVWTAYLLLPHLLRVTATGFVRLIEKGKRPHPIPLLAWKNLQHIPALRRIGSLLCLLLAALLTLLSCVDLVESYIDTFNQSVVAEQVAVAADRDTALQLEQMDGVDGTLFFSHHPAVKLDGEHIAFGVSTDGSPNGFLSLEDMPKERPVGNQLALSIGLAELLGKDVGDTVSVEIEGVTRPLVITKLLRTHSHFAVYDIRHFGLSYKMLLIDTADGADQGALTKELTSVLEQNGSVLLSKELVYGNLPVSFPAHSRLIEYAVTIAVSLTLLGSAMVLTQQFRARKNERHLLRISGMKRTELISLQAFELFSLLLLAAVFGALLWMLFCLTVHTGVASFGLKMFL